MEISSDEGFRPRLCLAVGITGHRLERLSEAGTQLPRLQLAIAEILEAIEKACRGVAVSAEGTFRSSAPALRLVSALAEGSDQIAALAALARGWTIDACLPFPRDEYANDFPGAAESEYRDVLDRANCVFELHGSRSEEAHAYEAVGRVILEQSDILIAVWDGDAARGRGGTAQVVAEAIAQKVPVIHLDPSGAGEARLLWSGLSDDEVEQSLPETVSGAPVGEALAKVIEALVAPPPPFPDGMMLGAFLEGNPRPAKGGRSYPFLLAAAGVKKLHSAQWKRTEPQACADELLDLLDEIGKDRRIGGERMTALATRYGRADAAALDYSRFYRSGFVANFTLAALAVLSALSGLILPGLKLPLIVGELLLVLTILLRIRRAKQAGWHERWLDNRHLAERLRALSLTSLLGDLSLRASNERGAAQIPSWVEWYSRATAREIGLMCSDASEPYLARVRDVALSLISRQVDYQRRSTAQAERMEHRLEIAGETLFGATIVACATWILMYVAGIPMAISGKVTATELVTFLTGVMPAFGAALYGIRMQADFAGLAGRSEATGDRLSHLERAIRQDPLRLDRLSERLRRLTDIMLADVDRWHSTYKVRPVSLPG